MKGFVFGSQKKRAARFEFKPVNTSTSALTKEQCSKILTDYRERKGLTQERLAAELKISLRALQSWEQQRSLPSYDKHSKVLELETK